ncbi:copper amine oxidase N-terminal domain-containing protein [Tissierella sp.]|uniref:copper amine oxidase N-terminal domain-containing protein n=1 Tax=Tissierella sp. TaxID=41274 RepID=UPI0028580CFF|nr:copper amine oxidase N-terminal domain-containing protein [Tissierella sp.]MDR7856312.1 copper amine oxidase N-terminal domain-containing protein [Tissierella sp.]
MSKKKFIIIVGVLLTLILTNSIVSANTPIKVMVDNKILSFDTDPFIENGTTLVPMRKIFESLNANVTWVNETNQIIATDNDNYIILTVGSKVAQKNGENIKLLIEPKIVNGSTYVPARFIAESLNADVQWDNSSRTVIIISKPMDRTQVKVYDDYVLYSTSSLKTLVSNLLSGDVVYFDGQYWATPDYANRITDEEIIYENDISADNDTETDGTGLLPDSEFEWEE